MGFHVRGFKLRFVCVFGGWGQLCAKFRGCVLVDIFLLLCIREDYFGGLFLLLCCLIRLCHISLQWIVRIPLRYLRIQNKRANRALNLFC